MNLSTKVKDRAASKTALSAEHERSVWVWGSPKGGGGSPPPPPQRRWGSHWCSLGATSPALWNCWDTRHPQSPTPETRAHDTHGAPEMFHILVLWEHVMALVPSVEKAEPWLRAETWFTQWPENVYSGAPADMRRCTGGAGASSGAPGGGGGHCPPPPPPDRTAPRAATPFGGTGAHPHERRRCQTPVRRGTSAAADSCRRAGAKQHRLAFDDWGRGGGGQKQERATFGMAKKFGAEQILTPILQ